MASFDELLRLFATAMNNIIANGGSLTTDSVIALCHEYAAVAGYTETAELLNTPSVHRLVHYTITGTDLKGEWPSDNSKPTWALSSVALTVATRAHHATTGRFAVMKFDPIIGETIIITEVSMPMKFPTAFDAWSSIDACWSVLFATRMSILTAALEAAVEEARQAQAQAAMNFAALAALEVAAEEARQAQAQAQAAMNFAALAPLDAYWYAVAFAFAFPEAAAFGCAAAEMFPGIDPVMFAALAPLVMQGPKDPQDGKKGGQDVTRAFVETMTVPHDTFIAAAGGR